MKIKFIFLILFKGIILLSCSQNKADAIIKNSTSISIHENTGSILDHTYEEYNKNEQLTKEYTISTDKKNHHLTYEYQYYNKLLKKLINYSMNKDEPLVIEYYYKNGKLNKNTFRFFKNNKEILKDNSSNYTDYIYNKNTTISNTYAYNSKTNKYLLIKKTEEKLDDKQNVIQIKSMDKNGNINLITNYEYKNNKVLNKSSVSGEYSYKYDQKGNLIEDILKTKSYNIITKYSYIYDTNGNWIEKSKFTLNPSNAKSKPTLIYRTKRTIEYY